MSLHAKPTFHMKMSLNFMKMNPQAERNSYEWVCTRTHFDTETQGYSEMAYCYGQAKLKDMLFVTDLNK